MDVDLVFADVDRAIYILRSTYNVSIVSRKHFVENTFLHTELHLFNQMDEEKI